MSKHTPGPWALAQSGESLDGHLCHGTLCVAGGHQIICAVSPPEPTPNDIANAQLIAAAPDLLASPRAIRAELWRREGPYIVASEYAYINDAIAKAEGKQ